MFKLWKHGFRSGSEMSSMWNTYGAIWDGLRLLNNSYFSLVQVINFNIPGCFLHKKTMSFAFFLLSSINFVLQA